MSVDGHYAGIPGKRQDKKARQGKLALFAKLGQADHNVRVAFIRLILVGAEQSVSLGKIEAEIAICLLNDH